MATSDAVQQPVRARNVELRVGVIPRGGWWHEGELLLESLVVLLFAGLLYSVLRNGLQGEQVAAALAEARRQLAEEAAARLPLQEKMRTVQEFAAGLENELAQVRSVLQQMELAQVEFQPPQQEPATTAEQPPDPVAARLAEAERTAAGLRDQLDQLTRSAEESQRAKAALHEAEQTIFSLRDQLEKVDRRDKDLAVLNQKRQDQDRAAIAGLQGRLENALNSGEEAAHARARAEAALEEAQEMIRTLQAKVQDAPRAALETGAAKTTAARTEPEPQATEPQATEPLADVPPRQGMPGEPPPDSTLSAAEAGPKLTKAARKRKEPADVEVDLWSRASRPDPDAPPPELVQSGPVPESPSQPVEEPTGLGRSSASPHAPVGPELRRAFHQILPLVVDHDPGAADCLEDNRDLFRSAFVPGDYAEFEEGLRRGKFNTALEHLKKAAKKHGIPL